MGAFRATIQHEGQDGNPLRPNTPRTPSVYGEMFTDRGWGSIIASWERASGFKDWLEFLFVKLFFLDLSDLRFHAKFRLNCEKTVFWETHK